MGLGLGVALGVGVGLGLGVYGIEGARHEAQLVEEREGGGCRVSLAARVEACRVVPARVVDYVAERALRRATKWL